MYLRVSVTNFFYSKKFSFHNFITIDLNNKMKKSGWWKLKCSRLDNKMNPYHNTNNAKVLNKIYRKKYNNNNNKDYQP